VGPPRGEPGVRGSNPRGPAIKNLGKLK